MRAPILVLALALAAPAWVQTAAQPEPDPTQLAPEGELGPAMEPVVNEQEVARRSRVYARVGDVRVTVGDIEDQIATQSPFLRGRYRDPARLREIADGLVRMELLAREAERRGYGENQVVQQSTKQLLVQQLIRTEFDQRITRASIPAADVAAYYAEHEAEFVTAEMVRAAHILLETEEAAAALVDEARAADASDFRRLVRENSLDTETKLRGGDLRYFTRDGHPVGARGDDPPVDEQIVAATFALETLGQVSDPVAVGENYAIIKLTGRREREVRTAEQADEGIRVQLWRERRQEAIDEFVQTLRRQASVEVQSERMRNIHLAPIDPAEGFPRQAQPTGMTSEMSPATMEPAPSESAME